MKKILQRLLLILIALSTKKVVSQDIHFSQFSETPLLNSPANTGLYNGYTRYTLNYRNQWLSMGNGFGAAFNTGALSVDAGLFKSNRRKAFMGIGATITYDQAGSANLRNTNILLHASGILKVSKRSVLSAGLCGGIVMANANYNNLTFASQFNGNYMVDNAALNGENSFRQYTTADVGVGMAYQYTKVRTDEDHDDIKQFKIAFGAYHLNRPTQDFMPGSAYNLPMRFTTEFTSKFDIKDTRYTFAPMGIMHIQGPAFQAMAGSYLKYRVTTGTKITGQKTIDALGIGLFYRTNDALIPMICYDKGDLSIGLSYDVNLSAYRTASRYMGGFEICLRYNTLANSLFQSRKEFQ
ncbi:MAG: PorP/SprF family type IX secretion system membrane protein [Bacteroidetes bacterium]|nr:PorP/SprF family type IX secretion system membrane protein [Bacteroidota bacterium]